MLHVSNLVSPVQLACTEQFTGRRGYRLSPDGLKIIEKRQMHKTILEYAPPTDPSESIAGAYHTHVLIDVPEDTDVMLVLTRQPRVPETIGAGAYIFTVDISGNITAADLPK